MSIKNLRYKGKKGHVNIKFSNLKKKVEKKEHGKHVKITHEFIDKMEIQEPASIKKIQVQESTYVNNPVKIPIPQEQPVMSQEDILDAGAAVSKFKTPNFIQIVNNAVKIPNVAMKDFKSVNVNSINDDNRDTRKIDVKYDVNFDQFDTKSVKISVHIYYDNNEKELIYYLLEPEINDKEEELILKMKEYIKEKVDIDFTTAEKASVSIYLDKLIKEGFEYFSFKNHERFDIIRYYVMRDFVGLEILEPLLNDFNIEDISCDGVNVPIYVYHRNSRIGTIRTNVVFKSSENLDKFVNKLAEKCGKTISISKPIVDGTLKNGSRVQTTLSTDISKRGSNFTIRMFTKNPLSPGDIIKSGTLDARILAYFWLLLENGRNFLISGGTATGKTSILNLISLFIKPQMKIITIEDTAELRIPHPNWISEVARTPISGESTDEIDMFTLLKESFRQRPDYIIVGEVRGKEAYVLFQQMAGGHSGLSTIHAEDFTKLVDRITNPPINLPPHIIQNLDVIIFMKRIRKGKTYIRRAHTITEVIGYDRESKLPVTNDVFKWNGKNDNYILSGNSVILKESSEMLGLSMDEIEKTIQERINIIEWIVQRDLKDYKEIASIIDLFYASPEDLMKKIKGGV